jgi:hypothetical protein
MNKTFLISIAAWVGFVTLICADGLYAGTTVPDVIKMENSAYEKHKKDIVELKHKVHAEELVKKYPELFENGCGECHHNDKGEPRKVLKIGDNVKNCIECHSKPGKMPKEIKREMRSKKASREKKKAKLFEYHTEALHDKCKQCHRQVRKKTKQKKVPISCSKCHTNDEL